MVTSDLLSRVRGLLPGRAEWRTLRRDPRRDLIAGVTVAVVALPVALAFGISSGMGAGAGPVTAVVAGVVAAAFGGSNVQVSGPTGAMTVVLVLLVLAVTGAAATSGSFPCRWSRVSPSASRA